MQLLKVAYRQTTPVYASCREDEAIAALTANPRLLAPHHVSKEHEAWRPQDLTSGRITNSADQDKKDWYCDHANSSRIYIGAFKGKGMTVIMQFILLCCHKTGQEVLCIPKYKAA